MKNAIVLFLLILSFSSYSQVKEPAGVNLVYCDAPNSAGGVDVGVIWENKSDKIVKYVTFTLTPYNRVNDICYDDITNASTISVRDIGPFEKGLYGEYGVWKNVWWNSTIDYFVCTKIKLEYMDRTIKIINLKIKSTENPSIKALADEKQKQKIYQEQMKEYEQKINQEHEKWMKEHEKTMKELKVLIENAEKSQI